MELEYYQKLKGMPSSVVKAMQYDADTGTLKIIYVSGSVYEYLKVPSHVYQEMRSALSKGTFLNTQIKGHYRYKKVK